MMDRRVTRFLATGITPPHLTEMELTSTASASVDTLEDRVTYHDSCSLRMPQEPTQSCCRIRLWNQGDMGWNKRNQDNGEDYKADDKDEESTISSSLQCEPSLKIPSCDVPRPTFELKYRMSGMSYYKSDKGWGRHGTFIGSNWQILFGPAMHNR
jgi:hypothetical protein